MIKQRILAITLLTACISEPKESDLIGDSDRPFSPDVSEIQTMTNEGVPDPDNRGNSFSNENLELSMLDLKI